jgi:predicted membrane GTPase involved in stress response
MFVLYNTLLRCFGFCGAVAEGIEFASDEFWTQWKSVDVDAWVESSGHRFVCHELRLHRQGLHDMSTTKDRKIALEYSGVYKGLVGSVVCIETSTTNNGAVISEFSQAQSPKSQLCIGLIESMY